MRQSSQLSFTCANWNTRKRCEISSMLTTKTPEQRQWSRSGVFIVNLEHISYVFLLFLLLTLNKQLLAGIRCLRRLVNFLLMYSSEWRSAGMKSCFSKCLPQKNKENSLQMKEWEKCSEFLTEDLKTKLNHTKRPNNYSRISMQVLKRCL